MRWLIRVIKDWLLWHPSISCWQIRILRISLVVRTGGVILNCGNSQFPDITFFHTFKSPYGISPRLIGRMDCHLNAYGIQFRRWVASYSRCRDLSAKHSPFLTFLLLMLLIYIYIYIYRSHLCSVFLLQVSSRAQNMEPHRSSSQVFKTPHVKLGTRIHGRC